MDTFDYTINYMLQSDLDDENPDRYVNNYEAEILVYKPSGELIKIGRMYFSTILINQIIDQNYNLFHVFDSSISILDFGLEFIDFENKEYNEHFMKYADKDMYLENICLITEYELIPAFRGKNLGSKILKDLYTRFGNGVGAIIVNSTPFQQTIMNNIDEDQYEDDDFLKALTFEDAEYDEETAQLKIKAFFQRSGFKYLTNNYFYVNTHFDQPKLMAADW